MNSKEINKFIKWYQSQEEFKKLPEKEKPIRLAEMIIKVGKIKIKD